MCTLPCAVLTVLVRFAPLLSKRVWAPAKVLWSGAMLAPGTRPVPAALEVMGWRHAPHFPHSQRVVHRAAWARLAARRLLRGWLGAACAPTGVRGRGLEDPSERRRGEQLRAKGLSRAPGRAAQAHFVQASGRHGLRALRLGPLPGADRVGALPCGTALGPAARSPQERGRRPAQLTDRARQRLRGGGQRWPPQRDSVLVAARSVAALA
jgi:hypothetical protein